MLYIKQLYLLSLKRQESPQISTSLNSRHVASYISHFKEFYGQISRIFFYYHQAILRQITRNPITLCQEVLLDSNFIWHIQIVCRWYLKAELKKAWAMLYTTWHGLKNTNLKTDSTNPAWTKKKIITGFRCLHKTAIQIQIPSNNDSISIFYLKIFFSF